MKKAFFRLLGLIMAFVLCATIPFAVAKAYDPDARIFGTPPEDALKDFRS